MRPKPAPTFQEGRHERLQHPIPHHRRRRRGSVLPRGGGSGKPTLLLLHGFPTSSHMFRNLITDLAGDYHLAAPDHIGFGNSAMPSVADFEYSFDRLTEITEGLIEQLNLDRFAIYLHDYGAPIGLRIASRRPERITGLITQSGNAYVEGFTPFWDLLFAHAKDAPRIKKAFGSCSSPRQPVGNTPTAWRPIGSTGSHPRHGNSIRSGWTGSATTPSSSSCSGITSSISMPIRLFRST